MPRRPRIDTGGLVYHVLNRRVGRQTLFEHNRDYVQFERVLEEAVVRSGIRLTAYCLMPNHWHLLLWPHADGQLSETLRWLTVTHTQRWHAAHGTAGTGPLYQGRFKSFPVQTNGHFLTVARYVERNALRARLVRRAENWRWGSLWRHAQGDAAARGLLSAWPVARPRDWPRDWIEEVNQAQSAAELEALRRSVQRGQPYGGETWRTQTAQRLSLESTLRPRGRPRKSAADG